MPDRKPPDLSQSPSDRERRARARKAQHEAFSAHKGLATWGEDLVPLERFRAATRAAGQTLSAEARRTARAEFLAPHPDPTPVEGPFSRILVFGGVYSNHLALAAVLETAKSLGAEAVYCLGDLGGFGPSPEKVWPLLTSGGVRTLQGNYEQSLANGHEDCNCGYTDPRDNHFAELSYRYTERNSSDAFKKWMGHLPARRRVRLGKHELLLVHGSPRRVNEFLFDSTTPDAFLEVVLDQERADAILCTHTGLHWQRALPSGRQVANVGVIGRPANDGNTSVWYALLEARRNGELAIRLEPLAYNHEALAEEMRRERLPEEFVATIETGYWTTCLEILPARERALSKF